MVLSSTNKRISTCFKNKLDIKKLQILTIHISYQTRVTLNLIKLICLNLGKWQAEQTLKPPSGFDPRTRWLGVRHPSHKPFLQKMFFSVSEPSTFMKCVPFWVNIYLK